jgi:putative transposase
MSAKLAFIAAHASEHAVRLTCRVLDVARSWFHAWQRAAPLRAEGAARHEDLAGQIREVFEASKQRYGAPRIHAELRDRGHGVSKRSVAKLMRENGIRPPRGRRRVPITTTADMPMPSRRTCSTGTSRSSSPTRSGLPTSRTFPRTRAGSTWPR